MFNATVKELSLQVLEILKGLNYSESTLINVQRLHAGIARYHEQRGKEFCVPDVLDEYIQYIKERWQRGEIGKKHYWSLKCAAEHLKEYHETGQINCFYHQERNIMLNSHYEEILHDFVPNKKFGIRNHVRLKCGTNKYLSWLIQNGHDDINTVGAEEIQQFMLHCSKTLCGGSMREVKRFLKEFYKYLVNNSLTSNTYEKLLSFPIPIEQKILPAASQSEIAITLDSIDRSTVSGKRDYAIILLGAVTGLRGCDIANLKLADIDWRRGEIRIVQTKTSKSLTLPLTADVGKAIQDYILNGRAVCASKNVFVQVKAPFRELLTGRAVTGIYEYRRQKAGLPPGSFHALRRSVGVNMVTSGIPVTTVAQILGHKHIDSTKQYIALDSKHLKECALDFTGIEPERGAL